jgi:hypothetical protein
MVQKKSPLSHLLRIDSERLRQSMDAQHRCAEEEMRKLAREMRERARQDEGGIRIRSKNSGSLSVVV